MLDRARELCGAGTVGASERRAIILVKEDGLVAGRTVRGHIKLPLASVSCRNICANDLGNYVARLANDDLVAKHNSALADKVDVMERRAADGSSRKSDGCKLCRRSQHSRSANGDRHVEKRCFLLFRREFVGNRPPRRISSLAYLAALVKTVKLDDHAVDVVRERVARISDFSYMRGDLVIRGRHGSHRKCLKSKLGEPVKRLGVTRRRVTVEIERALLEIEHKNIKPSLCGDLRVELTERACRGISGICHKCLALCLALRVDILKYRSGHIDLASDGKRERFGKSQRYRLNGSQILRYVLADDTVASSRASHELTVLVAERDGQAVDLGLDRVGRRTESIAHLSAKILGLLKGKYVRERVHTRGVCDLFKFIECLAADSLRGRVRIVERGVLFLESFQLGVHHIVFVVGYLGSVVNVVSLRVVIQLTAEFFDSLDYFIINRRIHICLQIFNYIYYTNFSAVCQSN